MTPNDPLAAFRDEALPVATMVCRYPGEAVPAPAIEVVAVTSVFLIAAGIVAGLVLPAVLNLIVGADGRIFRQAVARIRKQSQAIGVAAVGLKLRMKQERG